MPAAESLPDRVGPYRVISRIAKSGTSTLYLGREEGPMGFARDVALKLVQNPMGGDPEISEELAREAAVCAKLNHPGIVRMHRFFEDGPWLVLVLEYVDGASLEELLAKLKTDGEKLTDNEIAHIGASVLDALAHGHAMVDEQGARTPVIHRGVSLSNVLLGRDGSVKLGGFGLAKILGRSPDTVIGLIKGAPRYMTPEQASGQAVTEKVDVYAAGLLLWELFSGTVPVGPSGSGLTAADLALLVDRKHAPMESLRSDLPRELVAVIDTAIEPAPEDRAITCPDMARWIRKFIPVAPGSKQLRERMAAKFPVGSRKAPAPIAAPPVTVDKVAAEKKSVEARFADKKPPEKSAKAGEKLPSPPPNHRATLMGLAPYVSPHAGASTHSPAASTPNATAANPAPAVAPSVESAVPPTAPGEMPVPLPRPPVRAPSITGQTQRFIPVLVTPAAFPPPPPPTPPEPSAVAGPPVNVPPPIFRETPAAPTTASFEALAPPPAFFAAPAPASAPVPPTPSSMASAPAPAPFTPAVPVSVAAPAPVEAEPLRFLTMPKPLLDARQKSIVLVAGGVIAVGVAVLIAIASHHPSKQAHAVAEASAAGAMGAPPTPTSTGGLPGSNPAPPAAASASATALLPSPASADSADSLVASSKDAKAGLPDHPYRGYGFLTVTSSTWGSVWVNMAKYGHIGSRLMVPCGVRMVSIGRNDHAGHNVWLAPSLSVKVPCGDSLEITMEPKPIRAAPAKRADPRAFDPGKI